MILSLFVFLSPALRPLPAAAEAGLSKDEAVLVTGTGSYRFTVEIAADDEARARGLMFRKRLGAREGMLFLYESERPISMWMKNTYIPLDMVFIHTDGRVERIAENTEPFSEEIIPSGAPVMAVLEIRAGTAAAIGLKPGDRVMHPRFKNASGR